MQNFLLPLQLLQGCEFDAKNGAVTKNGS